MPSTTVTEEDFYYPLHYMLPLLDGDEDAVGVDTYSIEPAVDTWEPVLSGPIQIAREVHENSDL